MILNKELEIPERKQLVDLKIDVNFDYSESFEIDTLKSLINHLEDIGATHFCFYADVDYEGCINDISVECLRIETDEEQKERIKQEQERKDSALRIKEQIEEYQERKRADVSIRTVQIEGR